MVNKTLLFGLFTLIHLSIHAAEVYVPIDKSHSGNLFVKAVINSNIHSQFMVDTGAGMITLNHELFKQLSSKNKIEKIGTVAARLANGKLEKMSLYKVHSFSIGKNCDLGEMEVAVMQHTGRNILGLSALIKAAPFAIHTNPMELVLSGCPLNNQTVANNLSSGSQTFVDGNKSKLINSSL